MSSHGGDDVTTAMADREQGHPLATIGHHPEWDVLVAAQWLGNPEHQPVLRPAAGLLVWGFAVIR